MGSAFPAFDLISCDAYIIFALFGMCTLSAHAYYCRDPSRIYDIVFDLNRTAMLTVIAVEGDRTSVFK